MLRPLKEDEFISYPCQVIKFLLGPPASFLNVLEALSSAKIVSLNNTGKSCYAFSRPNSSTFLDYFLSLHSLFEFNTPLVLIFLSPHFQPFPLGLLLVVCLVSFSFLILGLVSNPLSRIILVYVDHIDLVVSKTHIGHVLGL